jgi:hypothetical protein
MTAMDIRALVVLLRRQIKGLRVANVYDVSGRLYLLKLSKGGGGGKFQLLIESGIRIHTTTFVKNEKQVPSGFSMKLRKHLRTKKLTQIRQLGMDRVIDLQFGNDEHANHILVELYAQGNIILTDHEYTILSLLRSYTLEGGQPVPKENETVNDGELKEGDLQGPVRCAVNQKYPFGAAANQSEDNIITDPEQIKQMIVDFHAKQNTNDNEEPEAAPASKAGKTQQKQSKKGGKAQQKQQKEHKPAKEKLLNFKTLIQKMVPYTSAAYAEHVFREMGVESSQKVSIDSIET